MNDIQNFISFSYKLGSDFELVQGAGGNTSYKHEGNITVKASGTKLYEAMEKNIFVELELDKVLKKFENNDENLSDCIINNDNSGMRPSLETFLHALIAHKYVIHFHPISVLSLLIQDNAEELIKEYVNNKFKFAIVPYVKPGINLAIELNKVLKNDIQLIFLQNHGIILSANNLNELEDLLDNVKGIFKNLSIENKKLEPVTIKNYTQLNDENLNLIVDEVYFKAYKQGFYFPDQVIFLYNNILFLNSIAELTTQSNERDVIIIKDTGIFIKNTAKQTVNEMLVTSIKVLLGIGNLNRVNYLTEKQVHELVNWEAEKFRLKISS